MEMIVFLGRLGLAWRNDGRLSFLQQNSWFFFIPQGAFQEAPESNAACRRGDLQGWAARDRPEYPLGHRQSTAQDPHQNLRL